MNKKNKIILSVILGIVGATVLAVGCLYFLSAMTVNDFRKKSSAQLNSVIIEEKSDGNPAVLLANVPFADILNPDYKKIEQNQEKFANLLSEAKSYVFAKKWQNELSAIYNKNSAHDNPISSDILTGVNSYLAVIKNNFPNEKSRITEMQKLADIVVSSTTFSQINNSLATQLQSNSAWLDGLRDKLNSDINKYQNFAN